MVFNPAEVFSGKDFAPLAGRSEAFGFEVEIDHDSDELLKRHARLPAELRSGLGGVRMEKFHFRRPVVFRVDLDVFLPVQAGVGERFGYEFLDGMGFPRSDDIVARGVLLQDQPHRFDVFGGESPVALGVEISEVEELLLARFDAGEGGGDFPGDERLSVAGRFVVEENPVTGEEIVTFAVVAGHPVGISLGGGVGAVGMKGRGFALRGVGGAKHFTARSLVEASGDAGAAESFENPGRSETRDVARVLGEVEAHPDVTLGA